MENFYLILLTTLNMCWLDGQITQAIASPQTHREGDAVTVSDLQQKSILGCLGQPLGKVITIAGVVRQERSGTKSSLRDFLSVEVVNDHRLPQPVAIEFNLFVTAQVAKPVLGRAFKYVGYETGGFSGVPAEAFKYVPAVSTTSHQFHTFFQVLHEELDVVKTKSDLVQFNDRRVQVIGRYVSQTRPAPAITSSIDFKGNYTTANIVLEDGTKLPIFPTYNKQSLRSPEEVKAYDGKIVKVVGKITLDRNQSLNPDRQIALATFDGIWQNQSTF